MCWNDGYERRKFEARQKKQAEEYRALGRLDLKGIMISTGAACNSVNTQISHVLSALEMDESVAKGTIRISLSKDNTEDRAHRIGQALYEPLQ